MKKSRFSLYLLISVLSIITIGCARSSQNHNDTQQNRVAEIPMLNSYSNPVAFPYKPIENLEKPFKANNGEIVIHSGLSLEYNEEHEQAVWVAYLLTSEKVKKGVERTNSFKPDPKVSTQTANDKDYAGSGYDRGHLAPAADMSWSTTAMKESFYYSNMSPQEPGFNRGIWKKLEEQVRVWAETYDTLFVVTGPILEPGLPTIGLNKVSVPKAYYKALLRYNSTHSLALGFVLPNSKSSEPLQNFAVSIDSLEKITNIDFFHLLPDPIEEEMESKICFDCWIWKSNK